MKQQSLLFGLIGLLVGGFLSMMFVTKPVDIKINNLDKHFIEQMIPHHEGAVEMAELVQEKSERPELQTLAQAIITSQTGEIAQMKAWYKTWYGVDVSIDTNVGMGMGRGMMHGGMMDDETADIEALKNSTNFDKAFLEEMIPHHQMAVVMAKMLLAGTDRPEMKQLAENIIAAQEAEIAQMRSWLQTWFAN